MFRYQARGFVALAMVGVALVQIALGLTVVGKNKFVSTSMLLPVGFDLVGQRLDIGRVVMIVTDKS